MNNTDLMTADEAQRLLTTFQRGRERGDAADVWGPIDRLEDALRTVVAREAEVAALQASMPVRDPVTEEEIDVALVWIRQSDCDTSRRAAHTVEQLANDLAAVRGDRDSLRREVAELRAELDALRGAR